MMKRFTVPTLTILITILSALILVPQVLAQSESPTPAPSPAPADPNSQDDGESDIPLVHVVEDGESLFSIAQLYDTTIEILQQLNNIADPSVLYLGQELIIPGGGGDLVAAVHIVQVGDTLLNLATVYSTTIESVAAVNRLVKVDNLRAGLPLNIMSRTGSSKPALVNGLSYIVQPGDTLLTVAAEFGLSPFQIMAANELTYPVHLISNQRITIPLDLPYQPLPGSWQQVRMSTVPLIQGESAAIYVENGLDGSPVGTFAGQELKFAPYGSGYLSLIGLDAFTEPGQYRLEIAGGDELAWIPFSQDIEVISANFGTQYITVPETLNDLLRPEVRAGDEAILATPFDHFSEQPMWSTVFQSPVNNVPISAEYGAARSYNEGPIEIFHTGVDFAGAVGTPINAPATGTVIFSDTLPLHGNTLVVDHGLGVVTAYYHLSQIHVSPGDQVVVGQLMADGGSTGLSSGPHLHWDLRIHNVPVNGLQWIEEDLVGSLVGRPNKQSESDEGS